MSSPWPRPSSGRLHGILHLGRSWAGTKSSSTGGVPLSTTHSTGGVPCGDATGVRCVRVCVRAPVPALDRSALDVRAALQAGQRVAVASRRGTVCTSTRGELQWLGGGKCMRVCKCGALCGMRMCVGVCMLDVVCCMSESVHAISDNTHAMDPTCMSSSQNLTRHSIFKHGMLYKHIPTRVYFIPQI